MVFGWCTSSSSLCVSEDEGEDLSKDLDEATRGSTTEFEGDRFFEAEEIPESYEIKCPPAAPVSPLHADPASVVRAAAASKASSTHKKSDDIYIYPPGDTAQEGQEHTEEEEHVLCEICKISDTPGKLGGFFLVTRALRGYSTYPDRVKDTADALDKIYNWRREKGICDILSRKLPHHEIYHQSWPGYICGIDSDAHIIQYEKISDIDGGQFTKMIEDGTCELEDIVLLRSQVYEYLDHVKRSHSEKVGRRRYKQIVVMDLQDFKFSAFTTGVREILKPILAVGSDNYPEAMHKTFIINTPWSFRAVWSIVKVWVHPITREKIEVLGDSKKFLPKMQAAGMELSELPEFMGGSHKSQLIGDGITQLIAQNLKDSEPN